MYSLCYSYKFTIILIIIMKAILSLQQVQVCTLPNGNQSTCMRIHHCDTIWNEIKSHGRNVPKDLLEYINQHKCEDGIHVCCPHDAEINHQKDSVKKTQMKTSQSLLENDQCLLPDGVTQSKCVRLHSCSHFRNILRKYNGNAPKHVIDDINQHKCGADNIVCCPQVTTTVRDVPIIEPLDSTLQTISTTTETINYNDNSCTLPSGEQSTCMLLNNCDYFQNIFNEYGRNPPEHVITEIRQHICAVGNYVCCPRNKIIINPPIIPSPTYRPIPTTTTTTYRTTSTTPYRTVPTTTTRRTTSTTEYVMTPMTTTPRDKICTLPDGINQSTCVRLHHCDSILNILKQYNGNPPPDVIQYIKSHICGDKSNFICCPNNVNDITTTTTTSKSNVISILLDDPESQLFPMASDLQSLKSHRNINLINEPSCGSTEQYRIVSGNDVDVFEFPWAAMLGYQSSTKERIRWNCAGSLITKRFVLTAAHCVTNDLSIVRLGEYKTSTLKDCDDLSECLDPVQDVRIEKKISHFDYQRVLKVNDIALLKLASLADTDKNNVRTICLPIDDKHDISKIRNIERPFTIYGWGKSRNNDALGNVLKKAQVSEVKYQNCVDKYSNYPQIQIHQTTLCAGINNRSDLCKTDSGSGIASSIRSSREHMYLYGIKLQGVDCRNTNEILPELYTDIRYYLDWILNNIS